VAKEFKSYLGSFKALEKLISSDVFRTQAIKLTDNPYNICK